MSKKLGDIVEFNIDRLFNGAIDVDWLIDGSGKAAKAATSFVFHGPSSHGISQKDIGDSSHKLIDTASFVQRVVSRVESPTGNAFTLAIAGFGSGKSHLAVTISELLSSEDRELRANILKNIAQADNRIGAEVARSCKNIGRVLVVTLNGMNNSDLSSVLLSQIRAKVSADGHDATKLENLRKRFKHASTLLHNLDERLTSRLVEECRLGSKEDVISRLDSFDEIVYKKTHAFLADIGIPLAAVNDETAKDVINIAVREFVGKGKPYAHMVILFDEFGHYMEYATSHPQIAGDGALQHLFEGVQGNDEKVTFVGFVQYELKAYAQRLPSEFKNEMNRFITRFDNAEKLYLSSNLETLIASLLQKNTTPEIDLKEADLVRDKIASWYPVSQNYSTWADPGMFNRVIVSGCWPLSPVAMWVLFYLSSSGKYLQQRSALTLLKSALDANASFVCDTALPPVRLWTKDLQQEFESIEEDSVHGTLLQSYNAICAKFDAHLTSEQKDVLRAIVLLSQTQLRAGSRSEADYALGVFSGLEPNSLSKAIATLQDDCNVIEWDNASRSYEILSDNASKPQFLHLMRQKAQEYDVDRQAEVFCGLASTISVLTPPECSFANSHSIITPEWRFEEKPTYWTRFLLTIGAIASELEKNTEFQSVESARGLMIHCYVPANEDIEAVKEHAQKQLKKFARHRPILLIFVQDDSEHNMSKALVDLDILSRLTTDEKARFGQLIASHEQKQRRVLDDSVRQALMARNYVTPFEDIQPNRLAMMELQLFEAAYPKVLAFPFDGYATPRGNAAKDCAEFTRRLISSDLSYSDTQTMGVAQRNRAQAVLNVAWRVFSKSDGSVVQKPGNLVVKAIMAEWEKQLSLQDGLNCAEAIKIACSAPYGANIASAGLLWGVFIQAYQKVIQAQFEGVPVGLETIAQSSFSGNSLDLVYLKGITLYRMTGENGAWDQLLSDWASCGTYREQAEFSERISELESNLPLPPALRHQIALCKSESKKAFDTIDAAEEKESDFIQKIENGIRAEKLSLIAYGASLLQTHAKELRKDPMWDIMRDIEPLITRVNEAKAQISALFPSWLARNQPHGSTQQDLAEFKRDSEERMARNLKNLEMYDEKEKLLAQVERVCRSFEQIVQAREAVTKFDTWNAQNGTIPDETPVSRLDAIGAESDKWVELIKACSATMKRVGNQHYADELANRLVRLDEIKKRLKEVRKAIDKRAAAVWNMELTMESAIQIRDEVVDLTGLYQGNDSNLEDFRIARNFINAYIDAATRIDSLQIPQSQFEILISETKDELVSRFEEEEPPWDAAETFDKLVVSIKQKRKKASAEWMAQAKLQYASIESLSLQEAEAALRELSNPPPYFVGEKDGGALNVLIGKIERHLESKGVDWLVEKFRQLSPQAQKSFLKAINA